MKPIRVLHLTDMLAYQSGVSAVILNLLRGMDSSAICSDVAISKEGLPALVEEVKAQGGEVYSLPDPAKGQFGAYKKALAALFLKGKYDILHAHVANSGFLYLPVAKKNGVHHRIVHSHNAAGAASARKAVRNRFLNRAIPKGANHFFACSQAAGAFLFGKSIAKDRLIIIPNAIDTRRFAFSLSEREALRREYGVQPNTKVIGHVGRFDPQKNHVFLLKAFAQFHEICPQSQLWLIGEGNLREEMVGLAESLSIRKTVRFCGRQEDMSPFYQAFDQFWLPSAFEGLPVSAVEAQCAGLPCFFSQAVTREVELTPNCTFLPVENPKSWAEAVFSKNSFAHRMDGSGLLAEKGYDIAAAGKRLMEEYYKIMAVEEK